MTTSNVLDQIAHRSQTRRARDLAFSLLLAAVAAFAVGSITTAASARTSAAQPAPTQVGLDESCAIELGC